MRQLTRNFNSSEFDCHDGTKVPKYYMANCLELAENLQVLRDCLDKSVFISGSGYRTESHNKKVKGARFSQHLTCRGADISVRDLTPKQVVRAIKKLIKLGQMKEGGIGLYNGFVHYDIRGYKARWDNSSWFNF